jgi:2-desacetyl-2-hydroxyethyl bacteriochlorophyllide A dehydrogenase
MMIFSYGVALDGPKRYEMKHQSIFFTNTYEINIQEKTLAPLHPGEILVKTQFSAISPGTELLIYRGYAPTKLATDDTIAALSGSLKYPLQYGYAAVGVVIKASADLSPQWINKTVFSFQPHQTHFITTPEQVIPLPEGISLQSAVFLPNMETAINFLMDGHPLIGERVAVFGQGIVGLLTTALLSKFPLKDLLTLDLYPNRRTASLDAGAFQSFDPNNMTTLSKVRGKNGIDLVFELSGSPKSVDQAISVTGFAGRVVVGSWYGRKRVSVDLGGHFHRSRIQIISSQVSSIAPSISGRWDKTRRFELAWEMINQVQPERWITHCLPFREAAQGYRLLDQNPDEVIQVLLDYTQI